jgi:hypothetical protein
LGNTTEQVLKNSTIESLNAAISREIKDSDNILRVSYTLETSAFVRSRLLLPALTRSACFVKGKPHPLVTVVSVLQVSDQTHAQLNNKSETLFSLLCRFEFGGSGARLTIVLPLIIALRLFVQTI